jgi:hypothetical protein
MTGKDMMMHKLSVLALAGVLVAQAAGAGDVPVEVSKLAGSQVALHVYPFLKAEELRTLRLVATNRDALSVFLPSKDKTRFAAMALAPDDGFLMDGAPAATAVALGDFPDAATAAKATVDACNAKRSKTAKKPCVTVLEVGPAK